MAIKKLPSTGDMPRSTGVPESLVPGGDGDSAGFAWEGRTFEHHGTEFADDDGTTPGELRAAVERVRDIAARLSETKAPADLEALAGAHADAMVALSHVRLLVPLVAEAGDTGLTPSGRVVEKSQELSIVTVSAPDGRSVMPVFSSTAAMSAWNPGARPIPVPGPQAALAAAQEGTDLMIVDPGAAAQELGVRRTQLEAVALGERRMPAWADPDVARAFKEGVATEPRISDVVVVPADFEARLLAPEVDVIVKIAAGLDRDELQSVLANAQRAWSATPVIAERVDSLRLRPLAV